MEQAALLLQASPAPGTAWAQVFHHPAASQLLGMRNQASGSQCWQQRQMDDGQSPEPSSHPQWSMILPVTPSQQGWQEGLRQPKTSIYLHHTTQAGSPVPGRCQGTPLSRPAVGIAWCITVATRALSPQVRLTLVSKGAGWAGQPGRAEVGQPPADSRQGTTSRRAEVTPSRAMSTHGCTL